MKLSSVEFTQTMRLPQLPGGRKITGQVSKIDSGEWLLDLHETGYVFVAHKDHLEEVTAYSPAVVKLTRLAPTPKATTKGK